MEMTGVALVGRRWADRLCHDRAVIESSHPLYSPLCLNIPNLPCAIRLRFGSIRIPWSPPGPVQEKVCAVKERAQPRFGAFLLRLPILISEITSFATYCKFLQIDECSISSQLFHFFNSTEGMYYRCLATQHEILSFYSTVMSFFF